MIWMLVSVVGLTAPLIYYLETRRPRVAFLEDPLKRQEGQGKEEKEKEEKEVKARESRTKQLFSEKDRAVLQQQMMKTKQESRLEVMMVSGLKYILLASTFLIPAVLVYSDERLANEINKIAHNIFSWAFPKFGGQDL